ncbi:MAG: extracellular solute-binding protein [Propionibacteriales bacterium]|nr:extracellular solute-binding protein [Propionibacteriales bacterium]
MRLAAAALALGLAASACGFEDEGDSGDSGEGTTLDLLVPSYSDNTKPLWEELIADFEADNPDISVTLQIESWEQINDVVRTRLQSDDAPDILNIDAFAGFAADDLLYQAADVVSEDTLNDFQESFVENASIDGEMYGLPFIASARTLFYNVDLLNRAGVNQPPETWDELLAAGKAVNDLGGGVFGYGMPLGNEEAQAETSIWTFGNGGSWGDENEITVDTPENLEAVEFMQRMIEEDATQPDPGATQRTPMLNVFIQGKIAMAEALPPTAAEIEEKNPDLNWDTAPIPTKDASMSCQAAVVVGLARCAVVSVR